jgi:hypothetical protein
MSLKTRIILLTTTRLLVISVAVFIMGCAGIVYAGGGAVESSDIYWKIICALMSALSSICIGIQVWIIGNQKELFTRVAKTEADDQTRKALCDERHRSRIQ